MASDVFFNRVPYTQRRGAPHDPLSAGVGTTHLQRSVGTTRSAGALTFPPLYLDPVDPHNTSDPASNQHGTNPSAQQPGSFVLGSTFYHHPELNALVSNHLVDASANALDGASGTGHAFLSSIFASRDGGAHDDDSDADEAVATGADTALAVPRPKITSEFVSLNEDLVPASLDMHGDMLPADQHPSYPFGNLFGPLGGMIAADSAIVGGVHGNTAGGVGASAGLGPGLGDAAATLGLDFCGGLNGFINIGHSSHGRRSAVSNAWNNFINKASRSKLVGSAGANTEWSLDAHQSSSTAASTSAAAAAVMARKDDEAGPSHLETIRAAKKLQLSPNLLFRTNTSTVLAPPTWPFRRHGPGSTSYAALLRPSSNIFGTSPASQAVAATLGGLPASSKILREVWSDLALEQLVPVHIGETSAVRHMNADQQDDADEADAGKKRGKKRARTDPDADSVFAKRIATVETDPLDLLGPISREIRGQANQPWGTATSRSDRAPRRRHRSTYSDQSADEAEEAEHDGNSGYAQRDRLRWSFALPPANFSWVESADEEEEAEEHVEPDGIGWSTAKRIFVSEERDRLLAEVASRGSGGVEAYRVRGLRGNAGLMPRGGWAWADGPVEDAADVSYVTEMSASGSHPSLAQESEEQVWGQGQGEAEDEELQHALLMQYQQEGDAAEAEDDVVDEGEEEDEAEVEYDLDAHYSDRDDDDVESFDDHTA